MRSAHNSVRILGRHLQHGFTLLEALIALLIFSVALLGLAAMYAQALQRSHSAYFRSMASLQVMDITETIRASVLMDSVEENELTVTFDCNNVSASNNACDDSGNPCTPQEYLDIAISNWCARNESLFSALFQTAKVDQIGNEDDLMVTFEWQERGIGADAEFEATDFEFRVRP